MNHSLVNLTDSGLSVTLDLSSGLLSFDESITPIEPEARMLSKAHVYFEQEEFIGKEMPLYYMYRDVRKKEDSERIYLSPYRFDITVVLPGTIGKEFNKTIGHIHPLSPFSHSHYTFTEVYSVLYGKAHYILQKYSEDLSHVIDIVDLTVNPGEHVLIPSFYGHVTVNTTDEPLVMANILYKDFASNYEPYLKNRGAGLYLQKKEGKMIWQMNQKYDTLPNPRSLDAIHLPAPHLKFKKPMYTQWVQNMEHFTYLFKPI